MQWLYETLLQRGVKLKPVTILGQGQTYEYLQRRYTRVPEGMFIEPSLRYVEETLQDLDLDPTSKGGLYTWIGKGPLGQRHGVRRCWMLRERRRTRRVSCAWFILLRTVLTFCTRCAHSPRTVSKPTEESWARLRRLGRYLVGHPRSQTLLRASGHMDVLYAISDSDWATDVRVKKVNKLWSLDG